MRKKIQAFEKVCLIISPARFLPVLIRLYQHQNEKQVPISIRIQNKDFKQSILGKKTLEDIIKFIENNTKLLSEFQTLMLYDENKNPNGLPYPLLIKMINEAPELLFMVLYRLRIYEDFKNDVSLLKGISQEEKNKVIFLTLTLYWFFAGTPRKKYPQLLSKIFPAMQVLPFDRFYSYETLQSATLNLDRYEHSLVFYNEVESWINTKDIPNNYKAILENRDFLLYAQRKALSTWFSNEYFDAKDTNRPFDYDHILPHNWIKGKKGINQELRDIYNTNGNFRAWPYWLNRGDQDKSPKEKLSFKNKKKINNSLLSLSLCSKDWLEINSDYEGSCKGKRKFGDLKTLIHVIKERNHTIYFEYMDNAEEALSLSQLDLNEEGDSLTIFSIFNDKIQNPNSKDIWKDINNGDYDNNAVIANNEEICFIVGKLNGSDERITLFSIVGTISEADSFSSKIEALADIFTIYVHKNYLKDNKEIPYGFLDGGEYITSEINLVSVTKQGMNDFICDIYAKLLILKEASQKDTDLAYEFKYYLKSAYKAMLTKKFPVNK